MPSAYVPLATAEDDAEGVREDELDDHDNRPQGVEEEQELMVDDSDGKIAPASKKVSVTLFANDKWRLVKPLLGRYMLPLCTFFFFYFWNFAFWIFYCLRFLFRFSFAFSTSYSH